MQYMQVQEINLGLYQHYSGKRYHVLGVCRHSETLEEMVVYQCLYEDYGLWVRPKDMFFEQVEIEGKKQSRFTYIGPLCTKAPVLR